MSRNVYDEELIYALLAKQRKTKVKTKNRVLRADRADNRVIGKQGNAFYFEINTYL